MTHCDRDADSVRAAIEALRLADSRRSDTAAPAFRSVLTRQRKVRAPVRFSPARLAAAAAVVTTLALGYRATTGRPKGLTLPTEVAALANWRPVTDVLLETPGRYLLRETPSLGASIISATITGDTP